MHQVSSINIASKTFHSSAPDEPITPRLGTLVIPYVILLILKISRFPSDCINQVNY